MKRISGKLWIGSVLCLLGLAGMLWQVGAAVAAGTYPITGTITLADGRPVEQVAIYLDNELAARSDLSGQYMVPAAAAGTHLLQPIKEGMTFVPVSVEVTLPPEAVGIDFTAFAASGGLDSTSTLQPKPVVETPWQVFLAGVRRWLRVVQQAWIILLALSTGAFLALAARRLRSGEWSLAFLFQHGGVSPTQPGHRSGEVQPPEIWGEEAEPGAEIQGVEAPFEVVSSTPAAAARRKVSVEVAQPVLRTSESAYPEAPGVEPVVAPLLEVPAGRPQRRARRIPVRPFQGLARVREEAPDQAAPQTGKPALSAPVGAELVLQGIVQARNGNFSEAELLLRQGLQRDADNAEGWFWLGTVKLSQGEARTAERCFVQAERLGHPQAAAALAKVKYML